MHRNLNPETIYNDETPNGDDLLRIFNFESCTLIKKEKQKYTDMNFIKSSIYCPPEFFKNEYDEKCDSWNCGAIMYFMLCGKAPFDSTNEEETSYLIQKGEINYDIVISDEISDQAKDLIQKLMDVDPNKR